MQRIKICLIYTIPIMFIVIGMITFFYIMSLNYSKAVSFVDWLFSGADNITATIRDTDGVMHYVHKFIFTRIFWLVWIVGFTFSLYVLGHHLHNKKKDISPNALLQGKQPYMVIKKIVRDYEMFKQSADDIEVKRRLILLAERFSYESDFGYGNSQTIDCENLIKHKLDLLENQVCSLAIESEEVNMIVIRDMIKEIDILLQERAELKKRKG